jgi:serine/threonine protein kinase
MAYELLTGHMPFDAGNAVAMRYKIEKADYTKPRILIPAVSDKLNTVIEKCLQVNPATRISAAGVEMLLGDKKKEPEKQNKTKTPTQLRVNRKTGMIAVAVVLVIAVAIIILNGSGGKDNTTQSSEQQQLIIDVPNASNAYIVFPDGNTQKLPYTLSGKEGDDFQFTLQAEGFESKKVEVPITVGRKSYEYNLEKIK